MIVDGLMAVSDHCKQLSGERGRRGTRIYGRTGQTSPWIQIVILPEMSITSLVLYNNVVECCRKPIVLKLIRGYLNVLIRSPKKVPR
jgi:hypothetical protein